MAFRSCKASQQRIGGAAGSRYRTATFRSVKQERPALESMPRPNKTVATTNRGGPIADTSPQQRKATGPPQPRPTTGNRASPDLHPNDPYRLATIEKRAVKEGLYASPRFHIFSRDTSAVFQNSETVE